MICRFSDKNIIINRFGWLILFLLPLLSSCSSNQKKVIEIITPPKSPKDFSFIPEQTYNPELNSLISADQKIKDIIVGRYDPFLPPHSKGNQLLIPDSFKFHGQIASEGVVNAFVSYQNELILYRDILYIHVYIYNNIKNFKLCKIITWITTTNGIPPRVT